jgi:transcriptional regulator with XRE-family HTH domain
MDLNSIRCNIKRLRKSARITQKEMAFKLFMDERTYSKFERGENKSMDIRLLASIASILEIDLPVLLQNSMEQESPPPQLTENGHQHHDLSHNGAAVKHTDIEHEIRTLREEVHALISYHKEALKMIKVYSE